MMTRRFASNRMWMTSTLLVLLLAGHSAAQVDSQNVSYRQALDDFERMASELTYLSLGSVLWEADPPSSAADPADDELHRHVLSRIAHPDYSAEHLRALLAHSDPKVVTLALAALFDREDPAFLPDLVSLAEDERPTFDGHPELALPAEGFYRGFSPQKEQTVGFFAKRMVAFYMKAAGFNYGIRHETQPGFEEYWESHRDRMHCASWFWVQLARASQRIDPARSNRVDEVQAVRRRIDALPRDEGTWTLLWLAGEQSSDALVDEDELLARCVELGPDELLRMLRRDIPSGDPDLQPRSSSNGPYRRMTLFVLRHASRLLRPGDAAALLDQETWERSSSEHGISDPTITPWWAVAAAELRPASAAEVLLAAFERFQGEYDEDERSQLCAALWRLGGEHGKRFARDWFFDEPPQLGNAFAPQAALLQSIASSPDRASRSWIANVIQDPRFDQLGWRALQEVVSVVNGWAPAPVVSNEQLRAAYHPLGISHFDAALDRALKDYPRETKALRETLEQWRARLRSSVSTWLR